MVDGLMIERKLRVAAASRQFGKRDPIRRFCFRRRRRRRGGGGCCSPVVQTIVGFPRTDDNNN